ncbi:MAG TPA: hypothetical protein DCZ10_05770 [Pelotomaculum sp.]|nr:hypothetical protein [Pelotomaculum sp.]
MIINSLLVKDSRSVRSELFNGKAGSRQGACFCRGEYRGQHCQQCDQKNS